MSKDKDTKEPVRTRGAGAGASGVKDDTPPASDSTAGTEEVAETAPAKAPPPSTDRLVVTNTTLERGDCTVAGKAYRITKGQQVRVPEEVRNVLREAGYLVSDTPAR